MLCCNLLLIQTKSAYNPAVDDGRCKKPSNSSKGVKSVQVCVSKLSEDSRLFFKGLNKISLKNIYQTQAISIGCCEELFRGLIKQTTAMNVFAIINVILKSRPVGSQFYINLNTVGYIFLQASK